MHDYVKRLESKVAKINCLQKKKTVNNVSLFKKRQFRCVRNARHI